MTLFLMGLIIGCPIGFLTMGFIFGAQKNAEVINPQEPPKFLDVVAEYAGGRWEVFTWRRASVLYDRNRVVLMRRAEMERRLEEADR